jgi:two-component system chemotaxis response regulator CheY
MARILVVDDAIFARMRCARLLTDNGYEVDEAANGAEALAKYKQQKPDAVLLDITMPDMDGQKSMVVEALEVGAKDFVVKPFDAARVLQAVQKLVS